MGKDAEIFSDRELLLLLNSVYERSMRLLDTSINLSRVRLDGKCVTKEDIETFHKGYIEHIKLVEKIRNIRSNTR